MRNTEKLIRNSRYLVITPDGVGSKGDEAMISGCLNLLQGQKALLITPNRHQWGDVLIGKTHLFDECFVPLEELPGLFKEPHHLIVMGADTLDGTCGYEAAHWRLEAMKAASLQGCKIIVFCSLRSDMSAELIQEWRALPGNIPVFLRDAISEKNFVDQVGKEPGRFPDLAFFANPIQTRRAKAFKKKLEKTKAQKRIIGLEISESMFRSFHTEITDDNRKAFAFEAAKLASRGLSPNENAFLLMTHDTRSWNEFWSDHQYACVAQEYLEKEGFSCMVQPPEFTQAELLFILPACELLICSRMHMSITSCCAGVVPLVVAGVGKNYVMIDKVRGMCREWMGTDQNLICELELIPQYRDMLLTGTQLQEALAQKREQLQKDLPAEFERFSEWLEIKPIAWEADAAQEEALLKALQRSEELSQELVSAQTLLQNKEAHIELLLQSERDLQDKNQALQNEIDSLQETWQNEKTGWQREKEEIEYSLACVQGECQQLRDKENHLKNEVSRLENSRSYRFGQFFARILRFFVPKGSRRALCCRLLWKIVRHPILFIRSVSVFKIKKFFRLLRKGEVERLNSLVERNIDGYIKSISTELDIVPIDMGVSKTQKDYAVLQVPRFENPKVSIVIPVYNQFEYTYHCVESILKNSGDVTYEILIANDCSTDLTTKIDKILPGVKCITNQKNLRFLLNCNNAAKYARGEYILFLNNDTQVQKNWLEPLVTLIESADDIGMVGSKLVYPDGLLQEAGGIFWKDGSAWNYGNGQNPADPEFNYVKQVDYISGAAIMLSRALWEEIGGFDELFVPAYCEDSDLAFTVRKMGYRVMYQPLSVVVHFEGVSNGTDLTSGQKAYQVVNQKKFLEKWSDELKTHPDNAEDIFHARDYSYGKKTLLMIDHYVPKYDQDAGSRTIFQYLKLFVNQGYNVKFIGDNFYKHEPYTTVLQQMGVEVLYGPHYAMHWKKWIADNAENLDYVFLSRPHISIKYIDYLRETTKAKLVYYGHDLHCWRAQRQYETTGDPAYLTEANEFEKMEFSIYKKVDMVYYLSELELEKLRSADPTIPLRRNPINIFDYMPKPAYSTEARSDLLFVGGFAHTPNVDAALFLIQEILPRVWEHSPNLCLHLVGSHPPKEITDLANENVIVEGFVSDERLEELYRQCRIGIVPLRFGAGVKGKVIEAMRYGLPLITTPTGAEGIPDVEGIISVGDTAEELADLVVNLYNDDERLLEMSESSWQYIQDNLSVENAVRILGEDFDFTANTKK